MNLDGRRGVFQQPVRGVLVVAMTGPAPGGGCRGVRRQRGGIGPASGDGPPGVRGVLSRFEWESAPEHAMPFAIATIARAAAGRWCAIG